MTPEMLDTLWKIAGVIFAAGMVWAELKAVRKDIARLEQKQDKYNHLQERVFKLEGEMQLCQRLVQKAGRN